MDNSYSFDEKCIERGKELLSEKRPLWFIKDFTGLDMSSGEDCVLGIVYREDEEKINLESEEDYYNGYLYGLHNLGLEDFDNRFYYGFSFEYYSHFDLARRKWAHTINLLREEYFSIERVEPRTELIYGDDEQYVEVPYSVNS